MQLSGIVQAWLARKLTGLVPGLILINVLYVADIYFQRGAGPVVAGSVWGLGGSGSMFSRLLLQPV